MTQAYFIIDTSLIRPKDLGRLDQLQGQLTTAGVVASFQKAGKQNSVTQLARQLTKKQVAKKDEPLVIIGNQASRNAALNGILAVQPALRWPLLLIKCPGKDFNLVDIVQNILTSLNQADLHQIPLGVASGQVPKEGKQYFLDNLAIGPEFSALIPKNSQKMIWKNALRQAFSFWGLASRNQHQLTFTWTLRSGRTYQRYPKALALQISLNAGLSDKNLIAVSLVSKASWIHLFRTYLLRQKNNQPFDRQGWTTFVSQENAAFHIQDIQTVRADGRSLPAGAYSFTITQAGTYPCLLNQVTTKSEKNN